MLVVLLLGFANGLRTMTPIAVVCWAAWLGYLPLDGWASWAGTLPAVIVFTLCAAGEWVADVLPMTPSRKAPGPFGARIVFGALSVAMAWHALGEPVAGGVVAGAVGATIGTLAGYKGRMWGARKIGRDWPVGVLESALTVGLAVFVVWNLHHALVDPPSTMLQIRSASTTRGIPA
ncbi:Uncharacterized membrane protein [Bryocella elongata]|uniref:Uncharacterized membrane protein n=1 Tax=Bryocella elongata TaxID=863522 RepID=A0A1H5YCH8_9BACT|nr:DUF4126 domain-containing protein [Bryocella elongata]SEG21809.1 Uncharacterized membrane protein [Bryocella elongata]